MKPNEENSDVTDTPSGPFADESLSKIFDSVVRIIYSLFGDNPGGHFLSFWVINFMVYIVTLGAIFQFIPSDLEWIGKAIFYSCIITAFFASVYSTYATRNKGPEYRTPLAILDSLRITVVGTVFIMILYGVFFFFNYPSYVTKPEFDQTVSDLRNEFRILDLNDKQINQIFELLREGKYVTRDELPDGLTGQQKTEVLEIINSSIQSFATTLTAMPQTSCYLTLLDTAESVYIRDKADKLAGKIIDYLNINEVALVHGNDGSPSDGWWYIEITHRGKTTRGWIGSKWVKLQNAENCSQIKQVATPFP